MAVFQHLIREFDLSSEELGVVDSVRKPQVIDMAVIGRLNVFNRLLEQLTAQATETEGILGQAKTDSDRQMHTVSSQAKTSMANFEFSRTRWGLSLHS
ncbi:MAG: hypothetical protein GY809_22535 [Planctomycetes bacterium]|nr:hypothetical protein [Planctomycetota bacterium]